MNIIVNGQNREMKEGVSLQETIIALSLEGKVMAAAVNMEIVKQDSWSDFILKNDDKLELLDFVGGG